MELRRKKESGTLQKLYPASGGDLSDKAAVRMNDWGLGLQSRCETSCITIGATRISAVTDGTYIYTYVY